MEDFGHPQADKIQMEKGILLKHGAGRIVLAGCGSRDGLLEVWVRGKGKVCLRVTGNSGYLSLEIPAVSGIKGNDYGTDVTMTVGDEEKNVSDAADAGRAVTVRTTASGAMTQLADIHQGPRT
ncbi:hypothetical protein [Streptomyces flavofungini]|uniref:hypothetical protein n=1 Tax=Streptomyces flavofungini TaxID=68200 RepID=UPI0025B01566|nr:hypothetical protein [Streptomyces flavofungini]WJV48667.1 hypothetical protein QUY26_26035 [Streptomyces flavofungini]